MPEAVELDLILIGFGHVGRRFVRLLDERRDALRAEAGTIARVVGVATARHGCAFDPAGLDATAAAARVEGGGSLADLSPAPPAGALDLIARARASARPSVVVETTVLDVRAGQPAIDHVRAAIAAGAHVVTANKGPAAFAYHDLAAAARAAGVAFLFEGAVMDGIPIFNLVRETMPLVRIEGFRGVINTTTNQILAGLERGEAFDTVLARMQAAGIAEADPSLDLNGWDAAAKTAALANVLMDARLTPHAIQRTGIGPAIAAPAKAALARGRRLKLVASAERRAGTVAGRVEPIELPAGDVLAGLDGPANALVLKTDLLGEVTIVQGAGDLTQTAYALVSDLVAVRRRLGAPPPASGRRTP
jgi:homoserine dehydrogenase